MAEDDQKKEEATAHEHAAPQGGEPSFMGILAYLGPLVIVPYMAVKDDPFVRFHVKQGLVLFVAELILWVASWLLIFLFPIIALLQLGVFILAIVGIMNVVNKKEAPLPIVGGFADRFKI